MEKVDLNLFEEAIEAANGEYRGEYNGRGFFKGYGGDFESTSDLVRLGFELAEMDLGQLADVSPHIDSMGRGVVVAWPARMFDVS